MSQNSEAVLDPFNLFRGPEYKEMFKNTKQNFENPHPDERIDGVIEWTKTWE